MLPSAVYLVFPHKSPGYQSFAKRGNPEGAAGVLSMGPEIIRLGMRLQAMRRGYQVA
jgi:hypothetical protein